MLVSLKPQLVPLGCTGAFFNVKKLQSFVAIFMVSGLQSLDDPLPANRNTEAILMNGILMAVEVVWPVRQTRLFP